MIVFVCEFSHNCVLICVCGCVPFYCHPPLNVNFHLNPPSRDYKYTIMIMMTTLTYYHHYHDQETTKDAIIGVPNLGLAYTTSFLVGFSDACFNTQVFLC